MKYPKKISFQADGKSWMGKKVSVVLIMFNSLQLLENEHWPLLNAV